VIAFYVVTRGGANRITSGPFDTIDEANTYAARLTVPTFVEAREPETEIPAPKITPCVRPIRFRRSPAVPEVTR
jgi:hypothetical protein